MIITKKEVRGGKPQPTTRQLQLQPDVASYPRNQSFLKATLKFSPIMLFGCCCISLVWLLAWVDVPEPLSNLIEPDYSFDLVKYAAAVPAAASIAVLEVFQVYEPVFSPSGVVDETTSSNGLENTTIITPTSTVSSCELLLMDYSFGYSYGHPFVGMLTLIPIVLS